MTSFIARREINRRSLTSGDPRRLYKTSAVDYTQTTVECEQWSVADSDHVV